MKAFLVVAALITSACGAAAPSSGAAASGSGWNCFSVTGVLKNPTTETTSECVRDLATCRADQATMAGEYPAATFVDCAGYGKSHCYTMATESGGSELCFMSQVDCEQNQGQVAAIYAEVPGGGPTACAMKF